MKRVKAVTLALALMIGVSTLSGCGDINMALKELKGNLVGNSFNAVIYDNYGNPGMTAHGDKVNVTSNAVESYKVNTDGQFVKEYELSSVITVNIDGSQLTSCGDTIVFYEDGLEPDVDFVSLGLNLGTSSSDLGDSTFITGIVGKYKNMFGKGRVVVVKSQMGTPICAFSGDKVTWEVADNIPKFTRIIIDGRALYLHRNNYNIIDIELLNTGE